VAPKYDLSRFRTTPVWPGKVIVPPPLRPLDDVEVKGDWILWPAPRPGVRRQAELPEDFYLRELVDQDMDDLDHVAELIRTYGPFCSSTLDDLEQRLQHRYARVPSRPSGVDRAVDGCHRECIELHVRTGRRAVEIWTALQAEGGFDDFIESEVTSDLLLQMRSDVEGGLDSLDDLQRLLIDERERELEATINAALGRFSIGIGDLAARNPTIYSVSFLQMYNHVAEGATLRTCENETCGQTFVRQRGRAQYSQHRTRGVMYCSRGCARAQAQRNFRRKQK
jgi:hypothetical protein